jgi:hypothetical protein
MARKKGAGDSSLVDRGCEIRKNAGEGEALGASGGEEIALHTWYGCPGGDVARLAVSFGQAKEAVITGLRGL